MKQQIKERLSALRAQMTAHGIGAFVLTGTDPHLSEYVASHWMAREWISGFTGSAGTVAVLPGEAGLWTDSRYFLQAERELEGSGIALQREGLPQTPLLPDFLADRLPPGSSVGIDGRLFSLCQAEEWQQALSARGIVLTDCGDLLQEIWTDRPPLPQAPAEVYDMAYAGRSCREKLADVRLELSRRGAEALLLSALDEVAWTLNLRGNDVHCNPVTTAYLLVTPQEAVCFLAPEKVSPQVRTYLQEQGVRLLPYDAIMAHLAALSCQSLLADPHKTNFAACTALPAGCRLVRSQSSVALLKAVRNECEQEGIRTAMLRDGVALVRFLRWLEEAVPAGGQTELSVSAQLRAFRAEHPLYRGDSFDTIAGYAEHGAIVHYSATPQTDATLHPRGFLLLDSGAQYPDGTTDITRTIALGPLGAEEQVDYTLVLQGHIALAMARFPAGTRGAQLDVLARLPLWSRGMNYLHGTGHGVGHYLNVHEGPQSIRMNENPVPLLPGMVTSNEPGLYKAGSHGIRIENLTLVCRDMEGMYGDYLAFETLTLCPICTKGIVRSMLLPHEAAWLNDYHRTVWQRLSPLLQGADREWLHRACAPV